MTSDAQQQTDPRRDARRRAAAQRMAASRARRRQGGVGIIPVRVYWTDVDALVARGLLAPAESYLCDDIGVAIERLLERLRATARDGADHGQ